MPELNFKEDGKSVKISIDNGKLKIEMDAGELTIDEIKTIQETKKMCRGCGGLIAALGSVI